MRYVSCFVFCFILATGGNVLAQDITEESVAYKLFTGKKQLQPWADELEKAQPQTLKEIWETMDVLLRAQRDEAVLRLIPKAYERAILTPEDMGYSDVYRDLVAAALSSLPPKRAKLCITFYETFGAILCPAHSSDGVMNVMHKMKWSDGQVTDWLYARYQAALAFTPKNIDNKRMRHDYSRIDSVWQTSYTAGHWQRLYLDKLCESPKQNRNIQRIEDDARKSPDDMKKLDLFLATLDYRYRRGEKLKDTDWLLDAAGKSAFRAWVIRHRAEQYIEAETRERFLDKALAEPLTAGERDTFRAHLQKRSSMMQPEWSDEEIQAIFRAEVLDDLNEMYLASKRGDDAQRVMLEARELRKKHKLREGSLLLAGMTQSESGFRVVEAEIKAQEAQDETKPKYWLDRAAYYRGRNEAKDEEDALRRAMALFVGKPWDDERSDDRYYRHQALGNLLNFLWGQERSDEALGLFKVQRAAARHNPGVLQQMFQDFRGRDHKDLQLLLAEDLRDAYEWLKTNLQDDNRMSRDRVYMSAYLLSRNKQLTISANILGFENDPSAWDVLALMTHDYDFTWYVSRLLFPAGAPPKGEAHRFYPVQGQGADEKARKKFESMANRGKLNSEQLLILGNLLQEAGEYENANGVFLTRAKQANDIYYTAQSYRAISANYLAMGDWRNSEKYLDMTAELDKFFIGDLRPIADLAEKSGATKDAKRIRARIANLGITTQ